MSVTRPGDLHEVPTRQLLDAWEQHRLALVYARHGIGDPISPSRVARHALDELAVGQALADQLMASRWVSAVDALSNGATLAQTAAAMGLDVDEVVVGLRSWADDQVRHGLMTPAVRDEAYALLERPDDPV